MTDVMERARATQARPWVGVSPQISKTIAPQHRTYAFNVDEGRVMTLYELFDVKRDPFTSEVQRVAKLAGTLDNKQNYPQLSYDETEQLFQAAEESAEPLNVVMGRLFRARLTEGHLQKMAFCTPTFVTKTKKDMQVDLAAQEAKRVAFMETINKSEGAKKPK